MRAYITTAGARALLGDELAEFTPLQITLASAAVDRALRGAVYLVDDAGIATDADTRAAVQLATALHAQALDIRDDRAADEVAAGGALKSAGIDGVSYTYEAAAEATSTTLDRATGLAASAVAVLYSVGLLPIRGVLTYG